jgi:2-succinyl-5-enolpyruvyl-6-hydroxy-3-cyclohexene-1-carboxylate synthase
MAPQLDFRTVNTLWGSVLVETLVRCGVQRAVVSPGSRSTPLALAAATHPAVEAVPVLDERSAAFFALGQARVSGAPVALICTSGSAGAHWLPAVIEASEGGVPLLLVTADRPPELRACASGQTIDQRGLFGRFVTWEHELAVPEGRIELFRYLRQTVAHAVERTLLPQPGAVHLNVPLRDPLAPVEDGSARGLEGELADAFFSHLVPPAGPNGAELTLRVRPATTRGLIVAGPDAAANAPGYVAAVGKLASALGWPVLADGLSPLRHAGMPVVAHYEAILRNDAAARALVPRSVLCLGQWPTGKVLRRWLEGSGAEMALVTPRSDNRDALHGRTRHLRVTAAGLVAEAGGAGDRGYAAAWLQAEAQAQAALAKARGEGKASLGETDLVPLLDEHLPRAAPVYVASSMPVRDVEYFWPVNDRGRRFYYNRGANGIDGTLSTALGVAQAGGEPAFLLTGDLALLHDTNGFLLASRLRGALTAIVVDNRGGGIFEHLPIAQFDPPFEEFWATPQQVDLARLCAAYEVPHATLTTRDELVAALRSEPERGLRVLILATDRKRDAARRRSLLAQAAAAVRVG